MSEADSSIQVELDSGKRVKVKSSHVLLRFEEAAARRTDRAGPGARGRDRPRPGLGIRQPKASSASPTWRATTSTSRPGRCSRPPRCSACSTRRTISAAWPRACSARRRGNGQGRAAGHRAQAAAGAADPGMGRRAGGRPDAAADPRPALQDPVPSDKNAGGIQGGGRGVQARAALAAGPAQGRRRHLQPIPVPLAPLPVRGGSPRAPGSRRWRRRPSRTTCRALTWPRSRSTTRRRPRSTTRCRCAASARAPSSSACTSPRRGWRSCRTARSTRSRATACPPSTCPAGRSRCCPTASSRSTRWPKAATARR